MRTYQSVLPVATRKDCSEERTRERQIGRRIKANLEQIFNNGFWFCDSCQCRCERIEGENGQPARCDRCSSPRISFNRPTWLIQPGDFSGKEAA